MHRWLLALWILVFTPIVAVGDVAVRRGDYEARLGVNGLEVRYRGVPLVTGSRFTLFKPNYSGAYFSQADFTGLPTHVDSNRITVTGRIPDIDAEFIHQTFLDDKGVRIWFTLRITKAIDSSPVEFALAMFPPEEFAGGRYRVGTLYGYARPQTLPIEKPPTSAPGTQVITSGVNEMDLIGHRLEVKIQNLGSLSPTFYDMRSRQYPEPERVYWLLYQWGALQGEVTISARLSAKAASVRGDVVPVGGRLSIREGGKRVAVHSIFVSPNAHAAEKMAARELQRYLGEMVGTQLRLVEGSAPRLPSQGVIYVGRNQTARQKALYRDDEFARLGSDGFVLRAKGGNVLAAGGGYRGTVYAVFRLLEQLGCRFYAQELEVVPKKAQVEIPALLNIVDAPAFEWRAMWGTISPMKVGLSPGEWEARVGDMEMPKMMGTPPDGFWHHTMGFVLPADRLPTEYLAMVNGQRRVTEKYLQQYCLSNPGLQKAMTEAYLNWIASDPAPVYYPVHYGDTGQFCECESCKAWYAEKGSLSDAVIWFNNQIAQEVQKRFPGKFITTLAYWATRKPPVRERPLANNLIIFCAISECQGRPWSHPVNLKLNVKADLEQWIALHPLKGKGIITFEYPTTYYYVGYPYPALYAWVENVRYYQQLGLRGVYICGLSNGHLVHLYSHVMPRIMWNPQQDLGKLIDEFCRVWYGRAWQPMRQYVERIHRSAMQSTSQGVMDCHAGPGQRFFRELLTRQWLDETYKLFSQSEALAGEDVVKRRILREKWGLLFADLFLHAQQSTLLVPDSSERGYRRDMLSIDDYGRIAELLRISRELGQSWTVDSRLNFTLSRFTGFEPTKSPWWECPKVQQLMHSPEEFYRQLLSSGEDDLVSQQLVRLSNQNVAVDIIPALGGRIWRMYLPKLQQDVLFREPIPLTLLQTGVATSNYVSFGGYEEYVGARFGDPGWSQRFAASRTEDGQSVTLTAELPNGFKLQRTISLLSDRAGVQIESALVNLSEQPQEVILRAHSQLSLMSQSTSLALVARSAEGRWVRLPLVTESYWSGESLPNGAWGVTDSSTGLTLLNEFNPSEVDRCYLYVAPNRAFYNLELFSKTRTLAPGESLSLKHRYLVLTDGLPP